MDLPNPRLPPRTGCRGPVRTTRLDASLAEESDQLPPGFHALVKDGPLAISPWLRVAIALGILGLMTVKPHALGSLTIMGAAIVIGLGAALRPSRRAAATTV